VGSLLQRDRCVCVLCESGPGSAEPKRGPGRPPVRLTSQPSLGGRSSKRKVGLGGAAVAAGTTPYGTNELVGRKIWCALLFLCGGIEARGSIWSCTSIKLSDENLQSGWMKALLTKSEAWDMAYES
jgi:hypothetical protein